MLKIILLIGLGVISQIVTAQTGKILGSVKNPQGRPVEFANLGLLGTSFGGLTNEKGNFEIDNLPMGKYTLVVSALGYDRYTQSLDLDSLQQSVVVNISLEESETLEEVTVTGTLQEVSKSDSPVPVEIYSARFYRANPTPSVFESLQNINGVRPQLNCNVCNTGDIHINGLEGPYTMVLLDGMPIVSGLSTVYGLTGIPQSLIERIEIVKGPASTLYGSEAVGGLINIITKKVGNVPKVAVDVFSSNWQDINTDIGIKIKATPKAQALVGINYFNYQNPIDRNNDGFTDITLQNRISFFNKWNFTRRDNKLFSIATRYVYEDRWGGQTQWTREFRGSDEIYGESIYTSRWEAVGTYQLPLKENITFQFSANGHQQNSVYGNTVYLADQYIGFGQLFWNKNLSQKNNLLLGAVYRYTYYDDNTPATAGLDTLNLTNKPSKIHLPGLFIQNEYSINEKNTFLVGARYDYNSIHGSIFTPRLNYKWNSLNKKNILRLSLGNDYRVANVFTEDHAALTGARQVVFEEALNPETSWNANVNFVKKITSLQNGFIGLDFSAWYTYFTNRIVPDYETDPNKIIYANLEGSSVSKGVSLNIDAVWNNGFKVLAGATFMDVSLQENGQTFSQLLTESFSGVWNIGYTLPWGGITLDYTGNVYGSMRLPLLSELDDRPEYSPWWSLQNIQVTKSLGQYFQVYGGIKNLLNYTPPANSIARPFDPFDRNVVFDGSGQVVATPDNPRALTFDPTYVFAPNQGIREFLGLPHTLN